MWKCLGQTSPWKATLDPNFSPDLEDSANLLKVNNVQHKFKINLANNDISRAAKGSFVQPTS